MSRNQRNYNGLHLPHSSLRVPPGQVPQFGSGSQEEQVKRAIAIELQALTRELYVRAAAGVVNDPSLTGEDFQSLARHSKMAAQAFFVGLGIIQLDDPPEQVTDDRPE